MFYTFCKCRWIFVDVYRNSWSYVYLNKCFVEIAIWKMVQKCFVENAFLNVPWYLSLTVTQAFFFHPICYRPCSVCTGSHAGLDLSIFPSNNLHPGYAVRFHDPILTAHIGWLWNLWCWYGGVATFQGGCCSTGKVDLWLWVWLTCLGNSGHLPPMFSVSLLSVTAKGAEIHID